MQEEENQNKGDNDFEDEEALVERKKKELLES
jgi:hypothetical protein